MNRSNIFAVAALLALSTNSYAANELPALPVPTPKPAGAAPTLPPPAVPSATRQPAQAPVSQTGATVHSYAAPALMCNINLKKNSIEADHEAQTILLKIALPKDCAIVLESKVDWLDVASDSKGILFDFKANTHDKPRVTNIQLQGYSGKAIKVTQAGIPAAVNTQKPIKIIEADAEASSPHNNAPTQE